MSNKNVTKIERLSSGMVKLYNKSNVIGAFSALNSISIGYENNNARTIQFTDNGNTISFQLFNLQEIIGSTTSVTYTPIDTTSTGPDYNARVFEVFDFLSSEVFQGFSPGPTYVGGVVAAYPNFASFPVTGTQSVIYIDEADNSAYYWDGTSYQLLVSTGVEQYASFALFPVTGSANVIYIDMSTFEPYVWDGAAYVSLTDSATVAWGNITGVLSDQTDLQAALDDKVPYTGATGNVNLGEYELKAGQLTLDTSPTGTAAVGTTQWNNSIGSSETTLKGGSVVLKNGVDLVARIVNKVTPNTTLTKAAYQAVRISGAAGQRLAVEFAQANNDNNSADTIGLVTETIPTNQEGFIMTVGNLEEINTTGSLQGETWADGDVLYLSPTTPGALTNVKPNGSNGHIVVMGYVEYAHAIHGKIYVKIMNGWELDELHNVYINAPTTWQVLRYDATAGYWTNSSLTASILPSGIDAAKIGAGTVDNTEFGYLNGVTSSIQTQLDSKFILPSLTSGSVLFSNGTTIAQDNANLFWDDTNNRLGIGTASPDRPLHINSASVSALRIDTTGSGSAIFFGNSSALIRWSNGSYFSNTGVYSGVADQQYITFDGTNTQVRLQIKASTGNIGIGTTTDAGFRLDVNGTARVSGTTTITPATLTGATATSALDISQTWNTTGTPIALKVNITDTASASLSDLMSLQVGGVSKFRVVKTGFFSFVAGGDILGNLCVGGSSINASSQLEIRSVTKGFLPPRMTTTQKNAIASPAAGLVVYDTTLNKLCVRTAAAWETITSV